MINLFVTLDNDHMILVKEDKAVSALEYGIIYMLSQDACDSVKAAVAQTMRNADLTEYIYKYDVRHLDSTQDLQCSKNLAKVISDGYSLILPISTPDSIEQQYLLAKADNGSWGSILPALISTAENLTTQSLMNAMQNLAVQEPDSCRVLINQITETWKKPEKPGQPEQKSLLGKVIGGFVNGVANLLIPGAGIGMAMAPTGGAIQGQLREDSYRRSLEIMDRFVGNCNILFRLQGKEKFTPKQEALLAKAQSEVTYVFSMITPQIFGDFSIQMMRKRDIALAYDNYINRIKLAEESRLTVSVETPKEEIDALIDPKVIKKIKTNGKYRVYLSDGEKTVQVRFSRKPSCIVYIIYLLDRKHRGEDIDTIKISDNKKAFCELYSQIYSESGASKAYNSLITLTEEDGVKRARLADCYMDIRDALTSAVASFKESPLPFYIPNEKSHITVLSEKIVLPESIESLNVVCKTEDNYGK